MKRVFIIYCILLLSSCVGTKAPASLTETTPNWIKEYPISTDHYIGIGMASQIKHPNEYMKIAKENALKKLTDEINISIVKQSLFTHINKEYLFEKELQLEIQKKSDQYLQGYQEIDSHIENNNYWVYYQISKTQYEEVRKARMEEAIDKSKEFLNQTDSKYSLKERYINFTKSIEVLKPFLNEPLKTKYEDKWVYLGSEIIARFRNFLHDFRILSLNKKIKVMAGSKLGNIKMGVEYNGVRQENIPLIVMADTLNVQEFSKVTNEKGEFIAIIPKITSTEPIQTMKIGLDLMQWISEATQDKFITKIVRSIKSHQITLPVYVYTPLIHIKCNEQEFGNKRSQNKLKQAAEQALIKKGFTTTNKKDEAELFMHIDSNTNKVREQKEEALHTVSLNLNIQIKDLKNMIVYSDKINKLKSTENSFVKANEEAYKNAEEQIIEKIIPDFVNSFVNN